MRIISPLRVPISKNKFWILNLNQYRNSHYQVLNDAKIAYKKLIKDQVEILPKLDKVFITYKLYPATKRKMDIGNITAIHRKFFEDALVELGKIPDDNYHHVLGSSEMFVEIDSINPRVEIYITEVKDEHPVKSK